jgi:hypothetical protein
MKNRSENLSPVMETPLGGRGSGFDVGLGLAQRMIHSERLFMLASFPLNFSR